MAVRTQSRPEGVREVQLAGLADSAPKRARPGSAEEKRAEVLGLRTGAKGQGCWKEVG